MGKIILTKFVIGFLFFCDVKDSFAKETNPLAESLMTLNGKLTRPNKNKPVSFSESQKLDLILSKFDQKETLKYLLDCMDDDRSSQSIFEKNQVSIGYLCFYSMMRIMTADDKKLNTKGFNLSPSNSKKDLNELKKLWEKTIEENAFNFIEN